MLNQERQFGIIMLKLLKRFGVGILAQPVYLFTL